MGFFSKSKEPARSHTVIVAGGVRIPAHIAAVSPLHRRPTTTAAIYQPPKRGMWVFHPDHGVGVLLNMHDGNSALVMFTDATEGLNRIEATVPATSLRQAWYEEIPAGRRPTIERAESMGYHNRPAWT
jgi:hypothetical protein